jgi:2-phospho-L-lactate guanylyltransferase
MSRAVSKAAVLVPVKDFRRAKLRLAPTLSAAEREALAREMATHVVHAAAPLPVSVVCDDSHVADWAGELGAEVIWCPGTGLNGAVRRGVEQLATVGYERVVVAHGDLPLAGGFSSLTAWRGVSIVPDRHNDGTNVIAIPTAAGFTFAYGPGSYQRHLAEARRCGLGIEISRDATLTWDVDLPADLVLPARQLAGS